jgi:hypothetical protein
MCGTECELNFTLCTRIYCWAKNSVHQGTLMRCKRIVTTRPHLQVSVPRAPSRLQHLRPRGCASFPGNPPAPDEHLSTSVADTDIVNTAVQADASFSGTQAAPAAAHITKAQPSAIYPRLRSIKYKAGVRIAVPNSEFCTSIVTGSADMHADHAAGAADARASVTRFSGAISGDGGDSVNGQSANSDCRKEVLSVSETACKQSQDRNANSEGKLCQAQTGDTILQMDLFSPEVSSS